MEAVEVHAVVHRGDGPSGSLVEAMDLLFPLAGDRDHVPGALQREDAPFQPQEETMMRIHLKACPPHRVEVGAVASLPRPIHILDEAPLVALDDVVSARAHRPPRLKGEGQLSQDGGRPEDGKPMHGDAVDLRLRARGDQVNVVPAAPDEGREQPRRGRLDATVEGEGPADQRDLHRRARVPAVTCSIRGKISRRAAPKL